MYQRNAILLDNICCLTLVAMRQNWAALGCGNIYGLLKDRRH